MRVGILGGTGPAGRGLAVRLAAAGDGDVVIGSRDPDRAAEVAAGLVKAWPDRPLAITGASNEDTAACDLVVVATPWDGAVTASIQAALPGSLVSASFHHLPASEMEKLHAPIAADVLVCSDHREATEATVALVDRIDGLRGVDAGSLSQAAPIEAFTAVLITVNIRHKVHSTVRLAGYGDH